MRFARGLPGTRTCWILAAASFVFIRGSAERGNTCAYGHVLEEVSTLFVNEAVEANGDLHGLTRTNMPRQPNSDGIDGEWKRARRDERDRRTNGGGAKLGTSGSQARPSCAGM